LTGPSDPNEPVELDEAPIADEEAAEAPSPAPVPLNEADVPIALLAGPPVDPIVPLMPPRERVRTLIALWLLAVVVLLTLGGAAAVLSGAVSDANFKDVMATLLTPILGVFGTVTGFYYGTHASESASAHNDPPNR
jgi:hypothetical protein